MKRLPLTAMLVLLAAQQSAAIAQLAPSAQPAPAGLQRPQAAAAPAAGGPGARGPGGGMGQNDPGIPIHELPSNQQSGVDIDHYIGFPGNGFPKIWNGMMTRTMLSAGNPYAPGPKGAILEYRDDLSLATIEPHYQTGTQASDAIIVYYVDSGTGRIDTGPGTQAYELHQGVGVRLAPGTKQHIVNTGDAALNMVMLTWHENEGAKVKLPIKVVDSDAQPLNADRQHWIHTGKPMFNAPDGINIGVTPILFPPMSYAGPHAHAKGVEEIWVKLGSDTGYAILGSEIRKFTGIGAFLSPPNGVTTHSSMNLNEDHSQIWLYLSRRSPNFRPAPVH